MLVKSFALILFTFFQQGGAVEFFDCLEELLIGLIILPNVDFDIATSQEAGASCAQVVGLLDSLEYPSIRCAFVNDCVHEIFRTIRAEADQKLFESVSDLICFFHIRNIDQYPSLVFLLGNVDPSSWIFHKALPLRSCASWKESYPICKLATEGFMIHIPGEE